MLKKKILVIGASGFIGIHLCRILLNENFDVIALVRDQNSKKVNELIKMGAKVVSVGDLLIRKKIKNNFHNIKFVVNLAALAHLKINKTKFRYNAFNNIEHNIIKNFSNKKLNIIHISSAKVTDSDKKNSYSQYSIIKKKGEDLIRKYYKKHIILRPPLIYGPNVKANFLILIKAIENNLPLPFKYLDNKRSYMYIENFTNAIVYILKKRIFNGKTYDVGDNFIISTNKLAYLIGTYLNKKVRFFYIPNLIIKFFFKLIGKSDIFNKVMEDFNISNKVFIADTGWKPPYHYTYGIKKTCLWYIRTFRMKDGDFF